MKKVLISIFTLIFMISFVTTVNAATSGQIALAQSSNTIKAGEEVTITVSATDTNNISAVSYTGIKITDSNGTNTSKIEVTKVEAVNTNDWARYEEDSVIMYSYNGGKIQSAQVFKITVKAGDSITEGTYMVTLEGLKVYNADNAILSEEEMTTNIGNKSIQLTVSAKTDTEGNSEPTAEEPKKDAQKPTGDESTPKKTETEKTPTTTTEDTAGKKIDYAGAEDYAIGFVAVVMLGAVSFIKYRQYKNI